MMDEGEMWVAFVAGFLAVKFLVGWYGAIVMAWPAGRGVAGKAVLGALPVVALGGIAVTLMRWAASDVTGDLRYIGFYTLLGAAWLSLGVVLMGAFFDVSWRDDILGMNNTA
ncbi:MAG: hypothetical protein FWF84_01470, partial [Kiritimatiellaeota bacterium]|nr:hypothetical protein [Kiritimatiellota bacterium]